ncbi:antibiotic biosynthesis monooxygenase [Aureibaculum marinum]|uniref:Antibiotic biosynthesis monooxygenase n=1 Tax=Aureibaculum marinum TaxID=2487930 RepID=A0A3N4NNT3_9FLAO|nr:putative quinol monooxygenase [Aureibaculum marinum]RPD97964.1 antibiotic biosynthesis monooxygenase [Aureibaculum marinum]
MKKSYLTVVAKIEVNETDKTSMLSELKQLVSKSKTEEGNIDYILHTDNDNPNEFFVFEQWTNTEALKKHSQSKHYMQFKKASEGKLKEFVVHKMTEMVI